MAQNALGLAALRVVILAEVDDECVVAVRDSDLPVDGLRVGGGATLAVAVEVVDAEAVVAAEAADAAGVINVGVAVALK